MDEAIFQEHCLLEILDLFVDFFIFLELGLMTGLGKGAKTIKHSKCKLFSKGGGEGDPKVYIKLNRFFDELTTNHK